MRRWERTIGWALFGVLFGFLLVRPLKMNPVPLPPFIAAPVAAVAVVLFLAGRRVKRRRDGHPEAISALGASRVALLAVACERVSACFVAFSAVLGLSYLFGIPSQFNRAQALSMGLLFLACVALFVVALIVEKWCQIDDDELSSAASLPPVGKRTAGPAA